MKNIASFGVLLISLTLTGQELFLQNAYNRIATSLNGEWNYIVDPYENGFYDYRYEPFENAESVSKNAFFTNSKPTDKTDLIEYDFDKAPLIKVPGDWNTQKEKLYYYEGTVWYKKSFDYTKAHDSNRVFVYFGAANYEVDIYLNGEKLGKHVGGFTPFQFEVSPLLREKDNFLIVKVDNKRKREAVPTLNTDWWNYGGLTRDVKLIETPGTYINDYFIQLKKDDNRLITGYLELNGDDVSNKKITLEIPELKLKKELLTNVEGKALLEIKTKKIQYWSPENPKLYEVLLRTDGETLQDHIGFRTINTEGKYILLNGEPTFLRGICLHEESPNEGGGRANSQEEARKLLGWAKELGCNFVRLAHYPHNEYIIREADKMGIMVWEEDPVYWTIDWENEATYRNAENQLSEVIHRDKNRASVIIWSMANETPTSGARNEFLGSLAEHARQMDPTRLISAALEISRYEGNPTTLTISDSYADVVDVLSFNQYIGWYVGTPELAQRITWKITQDKPVIISEFGAGAKYGFHGDALTRWSEEYQADLYKETLKMIDKIEKLQGVTPWILKDFRSPRRLLNGIQDDYNRKGLISDKGEKKQAFFVLQDYYQKKPWKMSNNFPK
ncbi:beta-glucuronidase [Flavobacteriaceae bacterium TP-CH-4]|uniref:Beta-glucuronidase n=2 Tax=Pelagihabitans pacificus TaxID=2696054 RepID=A0A967AR34_9FLAO|nr:beta-glucuronidase [Pelagihabitans pacificus]